MSAAAFCLVQLASCLSFKWSLVVSRTRLGSDSVFHLWTRPAEGQGQGHGVNTSLISWWAGGHACPKSKLWSDFGFGMLQYICPALSSIFGTLKPDGCAKRRAVSTPPGTGGGARWGQEAAALFRRQVTTLYTAGSPENRELQIISSSFQSAFHCRATVVPEMQEIWLQIADFMPAHVVADLYAVNSQWTMLRNLTRLRDPAVARRVHTLHVHPYFVKEVLEREHEPVALVRHTHSLRGKFKGLFRDQKRLAHCARTSAVLEFRSVPDLIKTMLEVMSNLPHVSHYNIAWSGLSSICDLPVPFLAAAFRPSVLQLTLEISLEKTVDLLSHTAALENLEELDLFIRLDHLLPDEQYEQILVDHLAPAINRLHSSLQKLSLRLCEPLDMSPLFDSLRYLPFLDCLSRASELSGDGLTPTEDPLSEWINDALSYVTSPIKLRTLEASLTRFPVEAASMCITRFARTLTTLVLTGRHLPYDRVDELLRRAGAATRLQTLRLGAVTLSPELVDLLAEKLPALRHLKLLVRDVVGSEGDLPVYCNGSGDSVNSNEQTRARLGAFSPRWRGGAIRSGVCARLRSRAARSRIGCTTCHFPFLASTVVIVSELAGSRRLSLQLVNDAARVLASGCVEFGRVLWLADAGPLCCGHRLGGSGRVRAGESPDCAPQAALEWFPNRPISHPRKVRGCHTHSFSQGLIGAGAEKEVGAQESRFWCALGGYGYSESSVFSQDITARKECEAERIASGQSRRVVVKASLMDQQPNIPCTAATTFSEFTQPTSTSTMTWYPSLPPFISFGPRYLEPLQHAVIACPV
ncbi:hypothetical protein C8J57DRAFT_1219793 [Mycena rebaudengoi]|nr:hypothetical protein C8J57DRAFT_1219793 [Mycena rebaudengoi]